MPVTLVGWGSETYLLFFLSDVSFLNESNFLFVVDNRSDSGHDKNCDHDSETINPG